MRARQDVGVVEAWEVELEGGGEVVGDQKGLGESWTAENGNA